MSRDALGSLMPVDGPHPIAVALTATPWQEGEPLRTAVARLRAAACTGMAVATLSIVVPTTFAAEPAVAAPDVIAPTPPAQIAFIPDTIAPAADLLAPGTDMSVLDLLSTPALLLGTPLDIATAPTAAATMVTTAAGRVIADAKSHLGARYVHGATGPRVFDCIGLVLRSFSEAGELSKIGGWGNSSGYTLYSWARRHHLTSTTGGQPGDVVVWGGGAHVGIYLGNGMAISALVSGVRIAGVHALTNRFTAFIHTGLAAVKVAAPKAKVAAKSIGVRHAASTLVVRSGHSTSDQRLFTVKAGTKLTLIEAWKDAQHRLWYRVNANTHVGWILASGTRA